MTCTLQPVEAALAIELTAYTVAINYISIMLSCFRAQTIWRIAMVDVGFLCTAIFIFPIELLVLHKTRCCPYPHTARILLSKSVGQIRVNLAAQGKTKSALHWLGEHRKV